MKKYKKRTYLPLSTSKQNKTKTKIIQTTSLEDQKIPGGSTGEGLAFC